MKKFLSIITVTAAIALVITSCKSNTANTTKPVAFDDTVGLAQFQQWKAMNERESYNEYMNATTQTQPVKTVVKKSSSNSGSMSSSSTNTAKVAKKKGMSKSAKYAIIGGGGGAVLGAIINKKNRVAGGIIGGILGGGIGYGIGRSQDKKDGR